MSFLPLSQREQPTPDFVGPFEGVPEWMTAGLKQWVREAFDSAEDPLQVLRAYEQAARPPRYHADKNKAIERAIDDVALYEEYGLDLADFLLAYCHFELADDLSGVLDRSGSVYKVADRPEGGWLLQRKEPLETADCINELRPTNSKVADLIALARAALYGRKVDEKAAYAFVVEAVEIAMHPVVSPTNLKATLGTMNNTLRDAPAGRFQFALDGNPSGSLEAKDSVLSVAQALWTTQRRHGTDSREPITHREAEAAYIAGVALCGWFVGGAVARNT